MNPERKTPPATAAGVATKIKVLLIGGGHTNCQVVLDMPASSCESLRGCDCTMVSESRYGYYSGMIPGHVAGAYTDAACKLDLQSFCAAHGWSFIQGLVTKILPSEKRILMHNVAEADDDGQCGDLSISISYDTAAIDLGSRTRNPLGPVVWDPSANIVLTRPISVLDAKVTAALSALAGRTSSRTANVAVVGAGPAGTELAFALRQKIKDCFPEMMASITLISSGPQPLPLNCTMAQDLCLTALEEHSIAFLPSTRIVCYSAEDACIFSEEGDQLAADLTILATGAVSQQVQLDSAPDLPLDGNGFIRVNDHLQVIGHDTLFAVGDCNSFDSHHGAHPPKAGVYAVRAGPVLEKNIAAVIAGLKKEPYSAEFQAYEPQGDFLKLLVTGDNSAIGAKWGIAFRGRWVWLLKDYIDRAWMHRFGHAPPEHSPTKLAVAAVDGDESIVFNPTPQQAAELLCHRQDDTDYSQQLAILDRMRDDALFREQVIAVVVEEQEGKGSSQ